MTKSDLITFAKERHDDTRVQQQRVMVDAAAAALVAVAVDLPVYGERWKCTRV